MSCQTVKMYYRRTTSLTVRPASTPGLSGPKRKSKRYFRSIDRSTKHSIRMRDIVKTFHKNSNCILLKTQRVRKIGLSKNVSLKTIFPDKTDKIGWSDTNKKKSFYPEGFTGSDPAIWTHRPSKQSLHDIPYSVSEYWLSKHFLRRCVSQILCLSTSGV